MALPPLFGRRRRAQAEAMLMLIVFVALMAALAVAALADKVPDTHRQVCQHGDFSF